MNKVYVCFPEGKAKCLTMSYDDGRVEDRRLVEIFNANGIKGTFNINYGIMTDPEGYPNANRIDVSEVKTLYEGHEVATHTMTHPTIERCPLSEVAWEILEDRKGLEALTGKMVRGNAYPNGSYSEEIKTLFRQLGIAYARTVGSDASYALPKDPLEWRPTCHHTDPELMKKAEFFVNFKKKQYLKLMYVWGHSYEFAPDKWHIIEEFCEYTGKKDDIWYATNIEIIDYMDAAKRLQFNAENTWCYNPSFITICLEVNGRYVEVPGGQMVTL